MAKYKWSVLLDGGEHVFTRDQYTGRTAHFVGTLAWRAEKTGRALEVGVDGSTVTFRFGEPTPTVSAASTETPNGSTATAAEVA